MRRYKKRGNIEGKIEDFLRNYVSRQRNKERDNVEYGINERCDLHG